MCATTARVSASSSSDWPAAVRPTRPLLRRAVCSAIARASVAGQPGNSADIFFAICATKALIILGAALRIPFPTQHPQFAVRQAFLFGLVERGFGNQNALAFVPPARAAETHDYRRKRAILPSSAGECGIPAGKVDKFIEIGAAHAESALAVLKQQVSLPQCLVTFGACGLAEDGEHNQVPRFCHRYDRVPERPGGARLILNLGAVATGPSQSSRTAKL